MRLHLFCFGISLGILPLGLGCGGKVVFTEDAGGAGGTGTSTQVGSTHGSTTSSKSATVGTSATSGTGGSCPAEVFIQGPCTTEGATCSVALACCGSSAICKGGMWVIEPNKCNEACLPCSGDFACVAEPGVICVDLQHDSGEWFECKKDLCPGSFDCSCDQPLCNANSLQCQSHTPTRLTCDCPNC